ncbi:class A beta-lactamase [Rhodanobacter umsongensis]|uniref:Beta-lactamase n=1 Tax=Rhodanobacter umsongensis TaxID=633153 RepID=A0ABW0JHG5_9GAMM
MNRRDLLKGALLGASAMALQPLPSLAVDSGGDAPARLAALERRHGGRLGVAVLDTGNGRRTVHRAHERFLMCSTCKLLIVAAVLACVDRGAEQLERRIVFDKGALLSYAPICETRAGAPGMTVAELCQAAITVSDNTAANLLLASLGGPAAVTAYARSLGDDMTRLDRIEPGLNLASPGGLFDTTTPSAMLADLQTLLLGHSLSEASRQQLLAWLRATTTGNSLLRAGIPHAWRVGDKTGRGPRFETNDIAIVWPPRRKPLLVTAYYAESTATDDERDAVLAEVGRIAAAI